MADITLFDTFRYNPANARIEGYRGDEIETIRTAIRRMGVVVLRGVYPTDVCKSLRAEVFRYFHDHTPSNPPIAQDTPNYWRLDDNPEKAAVKRVNQFFSSFYWNADLAGEKLLMQAMTRLKNEIAGLPPEFALHGLEEGYMTYPGITHYPRGGGKLNKHIDPKNIQFCVIIASLSSRGEDYRSGGLYIEQNGEKIDIDHLVNIGDVYLINPEIVHGIDPIDPEVEGYQWHQIQGRWTLFPSLIEVKTTQGVKVEGLADLEDSRY